jgi:3-phenylpropionate/trans-cinnamate dioxygenase ferredoxin reductase subunit
MRTVAVIGTSLAGFSAAQQLRAQGFDGRLVMIGTEVHLPYDRPPLSKGFLTGTTDAARLALGEQSDFDELEADWILGDPAAAIRRTAASIELFSGEQVPADGVVIATGAWPKTLPGTEGVGGVHTLRTLDDAIALRTELTSGRPRVVVIGAGFIGAEVASSCRDLDLDVTIVEAAELPLVHALGQHMAEACADLHRGNGVGVRFGCGVEGIRTDMHRVAAVGLTSGEEIPADVVVTGIGVRPNTHWLTGSGLEIQDGVLCDAGGVTALPNIVAVGDVARVYRPDLGRSARTEHWTTASSQPRAAVTNLLAGHTIEHHTDQPYFWSDQYGVRIQFAGTTHPGDDLRIADGSVDDRNFLAYYDHDGQPTAVIAFNQPRAFARARRQLAKPTLVTPTN